MDKVPEISRDDYNTILLHTEKISNRQRSNSAATLEILKETFGEMTFFILLFVKWNKDFAIATRFNASSPAKRGNLFSEFVRIISGISHKYFGFKVGKNKSGDSNIVNLSTG